MQLVKIIIYLAVQIIRVHTDYVETRRAILTVEKLSTIGGNIVLTPKEKEANNILLSAKREVFKLAHQNVTLFPPASHFLEVKDDIEQSKVFSIIQKLPKGASLHTHLTSSVSTDFIMTNILQREHLYACNKTGKLRLQFFAPEKVNNLCGWQLVTHLREKNPQFDDWVRSQINLRSEIDPKPAYNNVHDKWSTFLGLFIALNGVKSFEPVFRDYLYQALKDHYEDNVYYVEFRANFPRLYNLDGTYLSSSQFLQLFREVVQNFKEEHPDFVGARMICSPHIKFNITGLENFLNDFLKLQRENPNEIAGFDLVGFEDQGDHLFEKLKKVQNNTNFFFHAGETNWYEHDDYNLVDAVLLGTKRISHGYAIMKHPKVLELVKQRDIAIEVSPISNQVLTYVSDLRNHPAATLIAHGYPIVVCNDDPGFWGAKGLSYDWYIVYMGMASKDAGLEFLKQLALNSLKYSSMTEIEKVQAIQNWEVSWDKFIDEIIKDKFNSFGY